NYEEELRQFRINQNILFRETIFRLQVSKLNLDSNVNIKTQEKLGIVSMTNILQQEIRSEPDSNRHRKVVITTNHHGRESIGSINRYYVNVKAEDNLKLRSHDTLRTVIWDSGKNRVLDFLIGVDSLRDSISIHEITTLYKKELAQKGIHTNFNVT